MAEISADEEAQLQQTIEMFEVIAQSQPDDCQSLEILKEAYVKLGRDQEVIDTSKRIAQANVKAGQLSSAILEYESVLKRFPDDPDVQAALAEIEGKANSFTAQPKAEAAVPDDSTGINAEPTAGGRASAAAVTGLDDGRSAMKQIFVGGNLLNEADFDLCWPTPDPGRAPVQVVSPFLQVLSDKSLLDTDQGLKHIGDRARIAFLPLENYDVDMELARGFPADICRRWCVLPFDRMSKSILVATANPFNKQAEAELTGVLKLRVLWYLTSPGDLVRILQDIFR